MSCRYNFHSPRLYTVPKQYQWLGEKGFFGQESSAIKRSMLQREVSLDRKVMMDSRTSGDSFSGKNVIESTAVATEIE